MNKRSLKFDLIDYIENQLVCAVFASKIMSFFCQLT